MDLPPFPLADGPALAEALATPGRLAAAPPLWRAAAALSPLGAIELSGGAAPEDAELLLRLWLARHGEEPGAFGAWFNLGALLTARGDRAEAAEAFAAALRRRPDLHAASVNLGLALEAAGERERAIEAWRRALPPPELRQALHNHLGRALEDAGRLAEGSEELRASLLLAPDQPDVQQHWLHMRQRMAAWPVLDPAMPGLPEAVQAMNVGPLGALALHEDPAAQREVAAAWLARKVAPAPLRLAPERGHAGEGARIRLGYLSSDFCRHAVSLLMAGVFERHDRTAFEVFGYDTAPGDDGSEVRARVLAALDHHRPVAPLTDEAAARRILADRIDILIDLNGLTRGARPGILRWKPAPVQATYLGYIGSVPLPELDWLLCDAVSIPEEEAAHYAPRPLPIEGCYQANDDRVPELPPVSREGEGLPEAGVVLACFSHHYKITPAVFAAWAEVARRVPGSVLWLLDGGPESRANLGAHWAAAGLDPGRLRFAPRAEPARYLARLGLADVFLDTWPCNAGAAASDALRMGVPIVTLAGRAFAGRMAASLLASVGLAEPCVARDAEGYVRRAVALAGDGRRRAMMRAHLVGGAWARTLGDTEGFTRRFEAALRRIVLRP